MIYGLMCVGLTLIFCVMRVTNFAQCEFMMAGMYAAYFCFALFGAHLSISTPLAWTAWQVRPLIGDEVLILVNQKELIAAIIAVAAVAGFAQCMAHSRLGRSLRAAADNPTAAVYMGINVERARHWPRMLEFAVANALVATLLGNPYYHRIMAFVTVWGIMGLARGASGGVPERIRFVMDSAAASLAFVKPILEGDSMARNGLDSTSSLMRHSRRRCRTRHLSCSVCMRPGPICFSCCPAVSDAKLLLEMMNEFGLGRGRLPTVSNGAAMGDTDLRAMDISDRRARLFPGTRI